MPTAVVGATGYNSLPLEEMYRRCAGERKSLSQMLEEADPTARYPLTEPESQLDAFERQMMRYGIRTTTDTKSMTPASTIEEFINPRHDGTGANRLVPEEKGGTRFWASNQPGSWVLYPEFINRQIRITPLPEDVLNEIVAIVTPTDTDLYKTIYLNDGGNTNSAQAARRLWRVSEGAEIPVGITLATAEHGVKLNKYGLKLRGTYEVYRRLRIDLFTIMLARVAMQIKLDLATQGMDVLVNGDGNSNSATNYNVSTFDPAAPAGPGSVTDNVSGLTSTITKGLTYQSWLKFRASLYPLRVSTVIGRLNELFQVLQLQFPNIDPLSMMAMLQQQQGKEGPVRGQLSLSTTIFEQDVRLVYHPYCAGGLLIGLDKRFALEQLIEQNSALTETDKDITSQLNEIVVSQVTGFDKVLALASSTLTFV